MGSPEKALLAPDLTAPEPKEVPCLQKDSKYCWLVVACGFITQICILGVLHAFGVFYVEFLREFHSSKAKTAWVGSIAYGLSMTFGPVASFIQNRYSNRVCMTLGGIICAASILGTSFMETLPQIFITFSLFYGIGTCFSITPTMTIAQDYFDKNLTLAVGIMTAGSSVGTLLFAPLSQALVDAFGWRNTFRCYSATSLLTAALSCLIKPLQKKSHIQRLKESPLKSLMRELKLWKNRVFVVWTLAITCVMFGYYIPYVHLISYAKDVGIPPENGSMFVMLLGACTATGRILFGKIVEFGVLNRLHMHQLSMVVTGTGVMLLPLITSFGGIIAYVIVVGLVDGCYVVLLPLLTSSLVGPENTVLAWGFLVGVSSFTFASGPAIAGALYDSTGSYNLAFHCAGIPILTGALILFLIPWAQRTSRTSNIMKVISVAAVNEPCSENSSDLDILSQRSGGSIQTIVGNKGVVIERTDVVSISTQTDNIDFGCLQQNFPLHGQCVEMNDALCQLQNNDRVLSRMLNQRQKTDKEMNPGRQEIPLVHTKSETLRSHPVHSFKQVISGPPALAVNVGDDISTGSLQLHNNTSSSVFSNPHSGPTMADSDNNKQDTTYPTMFPFTPSQSEVDVSTSTHQPTVVQDIANTVFPGDVCTMVFSQPGVSLETSQEHRPQQNLVNQGQESIQSIPLATGVLAEHENCRKTESSQETIDISEDMSVSQAWQAINSHFDTDSKPGPIDEVVSTNNSKKDEDAQTNAQLASFSSNNFPENSENTDICARNSVELTNTAECAIFNDVSVFSGENVLSIQDLMTSPPSIQTLKGDPAGSRDTTSSPIPETSFQNISLTVTSPRLVSSGQAANTEGSCEQEHLLYGVPVSCRMAQQAVDNAQFHGEAGGSGSTVLVGAASRPGECSETTTPGHIDVFSHLFKDE
ncbi:hypothetical protein ScPMuIL_013120 [Solemya velum]